MRQLLVASFLFADWCWRDPSESCQTDEDMDGFADCYDCDDTDPLVNPGMEDVAGNCADEDCDGALEPAVESADLLADGGAVFCGEGSEEAGAALLSLGDAAHGASGLAVGAPRRDAAGAVYVLPDGAAAAEARGRLLALREVASLVIQGPDQTEVGTSLAAMDLGEEGSADLFIGAPGYSLSGYNSFGAVYFVETAEAGAELQLETPERGECPPDTGFCLMNVDAPAGRLGEALVAGWLEDGGSVSPYLLAAAPGLDLDRGAVSLVLGSTNFSGRLLLGSEPVYTLTGEHVADSFGTALATGSLSGDGVSAALIGAPGLPSEGSVQVGGVYAVSMDVFDAGGWSELGVVDSASALLVHGSEPYQRLGAGLAAGDLDGDGDDDLVIGTQCAATDCLDHAWVIEGGQTEEPGGTVATRAVVDVSWSDRDDERRVPWTGPAARMLLDDADADGSCDLIIGRPAADDEAGATWVLHGPLAGALDLDAEGLSGVTVFGPESAGDQLGSALAGAGALGASLPLTVGAPRAFEGGGALIALPSGLLAEDR